MDIAQPTERLTESYARWRSSHLGQITDTLEQQLLFELLGSVADKTLLDVGCGDGALASELARRGAIVTGRDAERAVAEMARVLKPGGRLVIGELGRWSWWAAHRRIRGWFGNSTWQAAMFRTAEDLRGLADAAGLNGVKTRGGGHFPPFG